jgi:hypothetical protein
VAQLYSEQVARARRVGASLHECTVKSTADALAACQKIMDECGGFALVPKTPEEEEQLATLRRLRHYIRRSLPSRCVSGYVSLFKP